MTPEELIRFEKVERIVLGLTNASQVDPDVAKTLGLIITGVSSKSATAEDVTINEAGASTHTVLDDPDGFITIGGKNVPYYN